MTAMPESLASESTPAPKATKPAAGSPAAAPSKGLPPWATLAALVLAVAGVILGVIGLFLPKGGPGKFSDDQRNDAKTAICAAQSTVRQATGINTNMVNPVPGDPAGELAVAANARLALYGGGGFLHNQLEATPATPADLAKAVGDMATTMQTLSINYLAGASPNDSVQAPLRDNLKAEIAELDNLCQQ